MNLVVSQALATGLPVIATDHSGLPEQVIDGVNGLLAAENDPAALAEKILWMLEHSGSWPEFGRAGRGHVAANYEAQKRIEQQLADYRRLIAQS